MIENYGDVLKKIEGIDCDKTVKVQIFDGWQPVSVFDEHKKKCKAKRAWFKKKDASIIDETKNEEMVVSRRKKLTEAEREIVYDETRGAAFVCPLTMYLPQGNPFKKENRELKNGLNDMFLLRVFDKSVLNSAYAKYHDCILTNDGTVIYKSEARSIENMSGQILDEFYQIEYLTWKPCGTWKGIPELRTIELDDRMHKIYSLIAKYVAEKSVDECGIYKEEHEFETAKQLPAKIFTANPEFVGEVLSGVEEILAKKLESVKEDDTEKIGKIVRFGERIGSELKKIFKGKIEEAKAMPQPASYCIDTKSMFKEGTFDATELEALAKSSDEKSNQAPRKK